MELQNELDAKQAAADATAELDSLTEQKRQAGPAWTPEQETQLIGAKTRFGEAVTKGSALLGKSAADFTKGVYASRGQQDLSIAPAPIGSPRYLQQMGALEEKLPAPTTHEAKLENIGIRAPDGSISYRSTTDGGKTDALTGQPMAAFVPPGHAILAMGALSPGTPGQGFEDNAIHESLLRATQQIQNGQTPSESMPSLAAKYSKLYKIEQQIEPAPNVGIQKTVPNATYAPLHSAIDYYFRTTRPADSSATGALPNTAPAAAATTGGPTAALLQPPGASQGPQPAAPDAGGIVNGIWRPPAALPMQTTTPAPGVTVTPAVRGFDQQEVSRFQQDPAVAKARVADQMYNEMQRAAKYDTGYADLHLIYALAKVFDPGSAVRGEELVLGRNAAQWQNWVGGWFNYIKGGGRLNAATKSQMLDQAYTSAVSNFEEAVNIGDQTAKRLQANGLDPRAVLPDMPQPQKNDPREINRYGPGAYASGISNSPDNSEFIRIANVLQPGSAPVPLASTSVAGPAPSTPAIPPSNRSGINVATRPSAPAAAPNAAPTSGNPLLDWADSLTGRKRAQ
jgi:hypothetical protein